MATGALSAAAHRGAVVRAGAPRTSVGSLTPGARALVIWPLRGDRDRRARPGLLQPPVRALRGASFSTGRASTCEPPRQPRGQCCRAAVGAGLLSTTFAPVQVATLAIAVAGAAWALLRRWAAEKATMLGWIAKAIFRNDSRDLHTAMLAAFEKAGWPAYVHMVPGKVLVADPAACRYILEDLDAPKGDFYNNIREPVSGCPYLGNGLLTTPDPAHWASQRKALDRSFTPQRLREMVPKVDALALDLVDGLRGDAEAGRVIDMSYLMDCMALDVMGKAAMGSEFGLVRQAVETGCRGEEDEACVVASDDADGGAAAADLTKIPQLLRVVAIEMGEQFLKPYRRKLPPALMPRVASSIVAVREATIDLVNRRREEMKDPAFDASDLLSSIIAAGLSDEDTVDESITFVLAGGDTTARAMAFCLFYLSEYPEEQDKVLAELDAVVTDPSAPLTYDQVMSCTALTSAWKETLRLCPPAAGGPLRILAEDDDVITGGKEVLKKGTELILPPYVLGRRPDIWGGDAEQWRPSRWEEAGAAALTRDGYMPFSLGPRNCIGQGFSNMEAMTVMARLMGPGGYRLRKAEGREMTTKLAVTLVADPGVMVTLEKRR